MQSNDHVQETIKMVAEQVTDLKRQLSVKMRTANDLCALNGQPPMYADIDGDEPSISTTPDEYYGKTTPEVIRTILEKRKRANLGAASVAEIHVAMVAGGFQFQAAKESYARRGIYGILAQYPDFHRIPDGKYGLTSWYPAAKTKTQPAPRKPQKAAGAKTVKKEKPKPPTKKTPKPEPRANGVHAPVGDGTLIESVRDALRSVVSPFTFTHVAGGLSQKGITANRAQVKSVLYRLEKTGEVQVVQRGKGKKPSLYIKQKPVAAATGDRSN
jgi:hypothetical protein